MMFIGWIAIAFVIYYIYTNDKTPERGQYSKSPREILDERFVSGQIDEETYKRMKKQWKIGDIDDVL